MTTHCNADLIFWYFNILNIPRSNIVRWLQTTMQTGRMAVIMRWKHFDCIICHLHLCPSIYIYLSISSISSSFISAVFLSWSENILAAFFAIIIPFYPPCRIIIIIIIFVITITITIITIINIIIRRALDSQTATWSWWEKKPSLLQKLCSRS